MDRWAGRVLLLVVVLIIGVFYGISITRDGIAGVYGPQDGATEPGESYEWRSEPESGQTGGAREDDGTYAGEDESGTQEEGKTRRGRASKPDTAISRVAGKAGDLIRLLADGLIRLLVWLGDAVLS